jgi:hypothetical protein
MTGGTSRVEQDGPSGCFSAFIRSLRSHFVPGRSVFIGAKKGTISTVTLHHRFDVFFGAGEPNLLDKTSAIGGSSSAVPFQQVAAPGVVISKRKWDGIIRVIVALN